MVSGTASKAVRQVPFARPWVTDEDRAAVNRVLEGHILTHGPECKGFEQEFASLLGPAAHCVSVSSCMAALHLASLHFGFAPGDEVILPAETHVATAHAVEWVGAKPVFVDCEPETGNVSAELVEAAVTPRTKAISVVHYLGIPCELAALTAVAERHGLRLIEDCALAVGARYDGVHVGLHGDAGCFSFYPVKHLTTAEGGMFVSRHEEVASQVAVLRAFGVDRTHAERSVPGMYDVPSLGLNYRMSELQAALGRSQLRRFEENVERRRTNFRTIQSALAGVDGVTVLDSRSDRAENSFYCLGLVLRGGLAAKRLAIVDELNAAGVGTSIYYPQPVPRMRYYRERYGYEADRFPNATAISDGGIALPVGPHLEPGDAEYIATTLVQILERVTA